MATVYGIVTQAGGTAWLHSERGAGTVFTAEFPATAAAEAPDRRTPDAPPENRPGTVLVVDDETGIRDVAERILVRHGYDVLVAADADEACDLAERFQGVLDLVLSDVIMPGCNGPELIDRLRAIRPRIPVLFMSGYTGTELEQRASIGENYDLIEKPFSEQGLIAAVARSLSL